MVILSRDGCSYTEDQVLVIREFLLHLAELDYALFLKGMTPYEEGHTLLPSEHRGAGARV